MKFNKIGSFFLDVTSTVEFTVNVGAAGFNVTAHDGGDYLHW